MAKYKDLSIDFCGVKCENPFFLSSSPVGSNYDMCAKALEAGWGGIGFKNMEQISDKPLEKNLEAMARLKKDYPNKVLIASIMGENEEEWKKLAKLVTEAGADIIECNFSCPQMTSSAMGSDVGQNPELVKRYTEAVVSATDIPVMAKMTPNIGNMEIPAVAAVEGGAASVSAINTIKAITNINFDYNTAMPVVNGKSSISGYSGKAVRPIALRFIAQMAQYPDLKDIPLSGMGGIETWEDAAEFIMVGARNLQVTTAVMQYGYRIVEDMISGLSHFLEDKGYDSLEDLVGVALPNIIPAENIQRDFKIVVDVDEDKCVGCGQCYIACYDGAHQAIDWDEETRRPTINDDCVGCHLCLNVCPVEDCITPGEVKFKEGRKEYDVTVEGIIKH